MGLRQDSVELRTEPFFLYSSSIGPQSDFSIRESCPMCMTMKELCKE
jgi:hypothetical protein